MARPWNMALGEVIDASKPTPLYLQIVHGLIHEIERGRLTSGAYLPSSRGLATMLGVNRKTVVLAYEDLIAQGWLTSHGTRGTMVSDVLPKSAPARPVRPELAVKSVDAKAPAYAFHAPPVRPLALPSDTRTRLDEGSPDGRLFPEEVLGRAYRSAIQRAARHNRMLYGDPRGSAALRDGIAAMLRTERGLAVGPENICITRGSQNAIFLAARTLISPGDTVLVESLTYEPAVAAFRACGAKVEAVGLDDQGVDVEDVERRCRDGGVKAIFLTPHHQFPTTVALRPERRLRLLLLARQFNFAIIEDDYDHEFHFESQPLLPIASYAPSYVIYAGSLSKLLLPALRIGYIAAPKAFIDAVAHTVSLTDGMGNALTEDAAAELIESGELRRHARKATQVYAARRLAFAEAVSEAFGDRIRFKTPDGGLAFWLTFPDEGDLDRIEANAPDLGVRLASSRSFATREDAGRGLRIGFASLREDEARKALRTLAKAAGI
ncbi:PLP-dependent aminotransferase family protein [Caulobacter segnis]|uniref:MocR-like pyridoxine biosynthesis transcription factor PdxR n=1 Tax=Caulobacter segnis TaxID=88688 RepID=UPI001CBE528C|nr:PLP-dependent aminotransferase family protein [Caulobacter segnis]UAL12605.1 PLP-dependent aminotransferase family protein [Caulobacter segnis]